MILLDTDHLTVLQIPGSDRRTRLVARLALATNETVALPVVAVEEQMRGWLSSIAKEKKYRRQVAPYHELSRLFGFFARFDIAPFTEPAAELVDSFGRIQIRATDKKIAAIALAQDALLLTANRQDFERVPGLRFEN